MAPLNPLPRLLRGALALLPAFLAVLAALLPSWVPLIPLVPALFLAAAVLPAARGHENLWMFLLVASAAVPLNLRAVLLALDLPPLSAGPAPVTWLRGLVLALVLFSAEELVLGLAARLIWPRQKRIRLRR